MSRLSPNRILVIRLDRIGDVVLSTPVLSALRRHFPHAFIAMLVRPPCLDVVDGHPAVVAEEAEKVEAICRQHGAANVHAAKDDAERDRVWSARRSALPALAKLKPTCVLEDATVPRSKIPAMIQALEEISRKFALPIGTFGHAGDGNLHPTILTDRRNQEEWARVEAAVDAIFEKALELGGTLSGEHGIGLSKANYMTLEHDPVEMALMKQIKRTLDPNNIMNPGKRALD